jgi:octaprenyl-diphosphate synthase
MKRANHYKNIAKDALGVFPNSKEKQILLDIVDFCVNRAY